MDAVPLLAASGANAAWHRHRALALVPFCDVLKGCINCQEGDIVKGRTRIVGSENPSGGTKDENNEQTLAVDGLFD